jgi:hypothetical protein
MQQYSFTTNYRLGAWWFEPIDMMRKLALSGLLQFVQRGTALQVLVGCCISFASFGMHVWVLPYRETDANALKLFAEVVLFLTFLISFILRVLPRVEMYEPAGPEAYGYVLVGAFGAFAALFLALVARRCRRAPALYAHDAVEEDTGRQEHNVMLAALTRGAAQQSGNALTGVHEHPPVEPMAHALEQPLVEMFAIDNHPRTQSPMGRFYTWVNSF